MCWLAVLVGALLFASCSDRATRVVIVSTNDMHAQISNFPKLMTFVKQVRESNAHVLLVDAGDRISGDVYVDNAAEKGKPMYDLMKKAGYNVVIFGNHEFDHGQAALKGRLSQLEGNDFRVVCANICSEGSELGHIPPYGFLNEAGIKFCFLGLIQTDAKDHIPATNPRNLKDITFRYYREVADEHRSLKDSCDVFVGVTHIGYVPDSLLAVRIPDFDLIIGGHSHTWLDTGRMVNGVLVSQTGSGLKYAGLTCLDFCGKALVSKTYKSVLLDTFAEDPEALAMVNEYRNRPEFHEVVGKTSQGLKYKENVANLMADAMCEAAGCDFVFCNSGGVRINSIPVGDISAEVLYKMEPFANHVVVHELTLAEMKELVLNRFNGVNNPENRRIDLYFSKGRYTIRKDKKGLGMDVVFVGPDGNKLRDSNRKYKVGLSDYVSVTYDFAGQGKGVHTDIPIVKAMIQYVRGLGDVNNAEKRTFIE